jgi:TRAP-type mannitol/chloroaromatic compound transport system substrate-binding protein
LEASGQALWDEFYAGYQVKPFQGGNVGASYGGWFKKPIADFKGIKIRSVGLGGELLQRLGATALAIPPSDIYSSLERGVIDAVEFTAPATDERLGLHKIAPYYYRQTFTKPNGSSEFIVNLPFFNSLSTVQKQAIARLCGGELVDSLINSAKQNEEALVRLKEKGVIVSDFPPELIEKAKLEAVSLRADLLTRSPAARKIGEDYAVFQKNISW